MKKTFITIVILMIGQFIKAQISQKGFKVQTYTNKILKITFTPTQYNRNENLTNATLLNPLALNTHLFSVHDSTLVLQQSKLQFTSIHNGDYYGLSFHLQPDEAIYGGGERALPLNRRGEAFMLFNNPNYAYGIGAENLNYSVPFFMSNKGYGLFFDNGSKGYANIGKANNHQMEVAFMSGEINVFVIFGNNYQEILSNYHQLTGTQPMPPKWAFGNLMSRFGYTSESQVNDILGKMNDQKIPLDAIIFDLFWFGDSIKNTLGNLDWVSKDKWPNPKKMIANFTNQKIHTTLITEPFVLENTRTYDEAIKYFSVDAQNNPYFLKEFYFGHGGLIDIFRKDAGNWIWNNHYKKQINNGVTAWWTDLGEPEAHTADMLHNLKDYGAKRNLGGFEIHNIYGHYWNKMLFEHYAKDFPNQRLFHLNRSGFAGSQRFSIFPWSGDVERSWRGLQAQLPVMLGMSMSGVPYIHADAGGFALGEKDSELYVRWLQFASFTPIFRPHGTALGNIDPGAVSFPSEPALLDTPYRYYAKDVVNHRYQMLPYNYTLGYRQSKFAEPLVRPMFFDFKNDSNAVKQEKQFMWGSNILVAPIIEKGATKKQVYLPKGNWYEKNTNTIYNGEKFVNFDVHQFKIPILYKEGSFIPQYNTTGENTAKINKQNLQVTYIPSTSKSAYEMYDDDGESKFSIAKKEFELIKFLSFGKTDKRLQIHIRNNNGQYKGKPKQRDIQLIIPSIASKPTNILINGTAVKMPTTNSLINVNSSPFWNGVDNKNTLTIPIILKNEAIKIEVIW